jgi:hypothetical protein
MKERPIHEMEFSGVCAIIPVQNEAASIGNVLRQVYRAGVRSCVVVVNGSTDETPHVAQQVGAHSFTYFRVVHVFEALGPDVPKSVGAYVALRESPCTQWFLFIDGDWKGSFGPMLGDFLTESLSSGEEIHWVQARNVELPGANGQSLREDEEVWKSVLEKRYPELQHVAPSRVPLLVHKDVFAKISPFWLHNPGRWFAMCVLARSPDFRLRVSRTWDSKLVGNPTRGRDHAVRMAETLLGDAVEGCRLLYGRKPIRTWHGRRLDGYHSLRRVDLLRQWQTGM